MVAEGDDILAQYGISVPKQIRPHQIGGLPSTGVPRQTQERQIDQPKMFMQQKWFRTYEEMVRWRSHNAITDFRMVRMKKPWQGYRYQLHYNEPSVGTKSEGFIQ